MSLRDDLAAVLARDSRYTIHAYAFIFEAIEYTKTLQKRGKLREKGKRPPKTSRHVTGQQLSEGACALAIAHYGMLAKLVLNRWGIHTTSDLGEIVYTLIATGDLDKTPSDSRTDFDDVFDLDAALSRAFTLSADDVA